MEPPDRDEEAAREDAAQRDNTALPPADRPHPVTRPFRSEETARFSGSDPVIDHPVPPSILGVAVVYAESFFAKKSEPSTELGAVYRLHKGDLLFIGKHPPPKEVVLGNGRRSRITACHLFPFHPVGQSDLGRGYAYISGQHMTLEMGPDGVTVVRDFSRNGVYLRGQQRHLSTKGQDAEEIELIFEGTGGVRKPMVSQSFTGPETIVLGINLSEASPESKQLAEQQQIVVIPLAPAKSDGKEVD